MLIKRFPGAPSITKYRCAFRLAAVGNQVGDGDVGREVSAVTPKILPKELTGYLAEGVQLGVPNFSPRGYQVCKGSPTHAENAGEDFAAADTLHLAPHRSLNH